MHRRTWRLLFLAVAEYRQTGKGPPARGGKMPAQAFPCHRSGAGWLALVGQARGVRTTEEIMSALLHDLRVGKWVYADSSGKPALGGFLGRILCLPRAKDRQVVVLEVPDADPVVIEPQEIELMADTQEQLQEQFWQLRFTTTT